MARLTKKESLIKKIKAIISDWGSVHIGEVDGEESPVYNMMGKDNIALIDRFNQNDVQVTTHVHDTETSSDDIPYEDLKVETLEEILPILENYAVDMDKTMKRCKS